MLSPAVRVPDNLKASLLIGLLALLVYNVNLRSISAGDTYPARYLPFAVLHDHSVLLDSVSDSVAQGRMIPRIPRGTPFSHNGSPVAFWILQLPGGHTVSLYPLVTPLLVARAVPPGSRLSLGHRVGSAADGQGCANHGEGSCLADGCRLGGVVLHSAAAAN